MFFPQVPKCSIYVLTNISEEARELEKQLRQTLRRLVLTTTRKIEFREERNAFLVKGKEVSKVETKLGNSNAKETPRVTDSALGNLPEVDGFISQNPKLKTIEHAVKKVRTE
ncbi:hypothetical protein Rs2_06374 [Raphanus sativus]|nr:hypothetical protein Rs2_06374 [Raphanus sativus]